MEQPTSKVSSLKIELNIPYSQNLSHFPSFVMCSTNALWKLIVISTTQALIWFWLYYSQFLRSTIVICAPSLSRPMYHCRVLSADRHLKKSVHNNLLKKSIKTTLSYSFRQKCDCVMLYYIKTILQVNLADCHIHQIWQALPVSKMTFAHIHLLAR